MNFNKVNYSIILRTENSMKYGILARQEVSGYTVDEYPNIAIRQAGGYWYIDHIPTGLKISTFGCKSRKAALENYPEIYGDRIKDIEENRKDFLKQAAERLQAAPLDSDIASWETVNYCTIYNHRFDKVTDAARRAGLLIQKADNNTYMDGGNINIIGNPEALKPIKEIIEQYAKRDRQKAEEAAGEAQAAPAPEAVQPAPEAPEATQAAPVQPEPEAPQAPAGSPESISYNSPFWGQVVSFTGKLQSMKRADAIKAVQAAGGRAYADFPAGTTLLVVGTNPGEKKQEKYDRWIGQVKKITEAQFITMLKGA